MYCIDTFQSTLLVFIGFAMPSFWLALLLMSFFGIDLKLLPISGLTSMGYEHFTSWEKFLDLARHLTLPIMVYTVGSLAGMSRYMRSCMLEVLRQDYIKAVRAKGAPEKVTIFRHAFRNSSIPIITLIGMQIGSLMGGTVVIEQIFSIPGLGQMTLTGITQRDYPVVQGCVLFIAFVYVIINLLVDILYTYIDPRITYT